MTGCYFNAEVMIGLWGNIGGIVELGETVEEAVVREVKEETSLVVKESDLRLVGVYSGEGQHYVYRNGDEVYFINVLFETHIYQGEIKKDQESLELKWFPLDKLPENITRPYEQVREELLRRNR